MHTHNTHNHALIHTPVCGIVVLMCPVRNSMLNLNGRQDKEQTNKQLKHKSQSGGGGVLERGSGQ